jgi:uncharacterized membrane protein
MVGPVELIVAAFHDEEKASEVLKHLRILEKEDFILIANAAILKKDINGKVSLEETEDIHPGKGAVFGAIAGGLIGLLGGPLGVVVGATVGAATGGLAAGKIDMGFPDETLKELQETLKPNTSAILALIQYQWVDRVLVELDNYEATLFRQSLKDELATQLSADQNSPD